MSNGNFKYVVSQHTWNRARDFPSSLLADCFRVMRQAGVEIVPLETPFRRQNYIERPWGEKMCMGCGGRIVEMGETTLSGYCPCSCSMTDVTGERPEALFSKPPPLREECLRKLDSAQAEVKVGRSLVLAVQGDLSNCSVPYAVPGTLKYLAEELRGATQYLDDLRALIGTLSDER